MEAITYQKLKAFSSTIPEDLLAIWQPPQAVRALLEFEPQGDQSFSIAAGLEDEPGKPAKTMHFVGHHKALSLKWLRKHYNKVGNMLHVPTGGRLVEELLDDKVAYLKEVIADLEDAVASTITGGSIKTVYSFECKNCKLPVVANAEAVRKTGRAVCLNPQCGAEYFGVQNEGQMTFAPMVTQFDCVQCSAEIPIENKKLRIGLEFKCPKCGEKHTIVGRQWQYGNAESPDEATHSGSK
jgi:predicted RNA-binding Zn-ribbon protein involved in translation (DUF1610 family)